MLVDSKTKQEIKIDDVVETFRGKQAVVTDIADLVYIKNESGIPTRPYGVYPAVIGAEWLTEQITKHVDHYDVFTNRATAEKHYKNVLDLDNLFVASLSVIEKCIGDDPGSFVVAWTITVKNM